MRLSPFEVGIVLGIIAAYALLALVFVIGQVIVRWFLE